MDYCKRAARYADDIIAGKIPACEYVRLAAQRFIRDLERATKKGDIEFDAAEAERWCRFLEKLPHVKGRWAAKSERFVLSDWQIFCTVNIYGFRKNGKRRFREVYIEVPRKNGKSFWVAGLGVGHLCIDGEYGAEVYCGATTEKQAWEVFRPAKQICERTPALRAKYGLEVNAKSLNVLANGGRFEPVIGNPGDGPSPSCSITDEYHEHKDSDQVDTMETGMAAREQPLMLIITTSGVDTGGPCYAKRADGINILKGSVDDDTVFVIIYTLDEKDAWDTIEAQKKANPNYGISVDPDYLAGKLAQARRSATKQSAYKTKHLNLWVGAKAAWMNMLAYQRCRRARLNIEDFKGRRCYVGLDLASKVDIASAGIIFPPNDLTPKYSAFCRHYLPEDRIEDGGNTRYKAWHAEGWLTATPGNVTDFSYIEDDLDELKSSYEVVEVPYDPFQATQFSTHMIELGFPMIEYGQTVKNFSEPMKELEALILQKKMQFELDPVLMWMFGNVVAKLDKKDNIFPNKEREENKIDGVVALIMALGRIIAHKDDTSIYETRGIRTL